MKPTLFFLDGAVVAHGRVALAAQYNEYADVDASRVLLMLEDGWVRVDFDDDVICSMTFAESSGTLFMLGTSGIVYTVGGRSPVFTRDSIKGTRREHQLVDPEERGELTRIRCSSGRVFACGLGGQLYELQEGSWRNLSLTGPIDVCPDFADVTVDARGVPLTVGSNGAIYSLGPAGLQALDSPTNRYLLCVVAGSDKRCFASGKDGVVLSVRDSLFDDLSLDSPAGKNLWTIAEYMGVLYVCEPTRLLRRAVAGDAAWIVETVSVNPVPTFYRLIAAGEDLWSIGADHVFYKRGSHWQQLPIPGNEIPPQRA